MIPISIAVIPGVSRAMRLVFALALMLSPPAAAAQKTSLELRPRVGDTLRMAMDQEIEMTGTLKLAGADSTRSTRTTVHVVTRAVVMKSDKAGTTLTAEAESVTVNTDDERGAAMLADARKRLLGRTVELWMAPDGATKLVSAPAGADPAVGQLFAQMPATLPSGDVKVGESWTKEMNVPATGMPGPGGRLRTTFRLDSLTAASRFAWISLTGTLSPPQGRKSADHGGTVTGMILVDRRRGWLADTRTVASMWSLVEPAAALGGAAMSFRMKVSQRVKVLEP